MIRSVQENKARGFYISATRKSSGKTVISLGLGAALSQSGEAVQSYKKGPDYIDPMWHRAATGRACFNLDFFTQQHTEIRRTFERNRLSADVVYVEGNKGLFDGVDTLGSDSNAAMATLLGLPVVLIVNVQGMTRGIAPLLSGYENFSTDIDFAGVILNEVAGPRHEQKLLAAVKEYTNFRVLGAVPKLSSLHLEERHLGLVPQNEAPHAQAYIDQVANLVKQHVDIDRVLQHSAELLVPEPEREIRPTIPTVSTGPVIGLARDRAFGFYYPDDLLEMQRQGATLVYFDTLNDTQLPDVDALFIGGGFPETQLEKLHHNTVMRRQICDFVKAGKPVYAECGGLMYLCRSIRYEDDDAEMVGVIDAKVTMTPKPIGRGYAKITPKAGHPWASGMPDQSAQQIACHEFHYSSLQGPAQKNKMAYSVQRGFGIDGENDGIIVNNMLATYCHQRHTKNNPWVTHFIKFIQSTKTY